jgi:hypothetical protein
MMAESLLLLLFLSAVIRRLGLDLGERKAKKRKGEGMEGECIFAVLVLVLKGGGGVEWLGVDSGIGWLFGLGGG